MRQAFLVLIVTFTLSLNAQSQYWITFKDKGVHADALLNNPESFLSSNVLARRSLFDIPITKSDLPVHQAYLTQISALGAAVTKQSKWLNGVFVETSDPNFQSKLATLNFIKNVVPITSQKQGNFQDKLNNNVVNNKCVDGSPIYGCGFDAINMLQGQFLHQQGFTANSIEIAVMDNGFQNVNSNRFFDSLNLQNKIHGIYNYVNDNANVFVNGDHGSEVMSTMAANMKDSLVGTAPDANYYLFITEDNNNEGLAEEINWAMAAEWAETNLGTWVILSTSLGYSEGFSDPSTNHVYADMDGNTTIITTAADLAAQKGLLVVNSAGNEGTANWRYITAPADGDSVLAVGAVDFEGLAAEFTSFGPSADGRIKPNVSALGRRVVIADKNGVLGLTNGTSFSAPIIAGMAACLWEAFPSKSNMEIINAIEQSAHLYYNPNDQLGYGIPNFEKAYEILAIAEANEAEGLRIFPNPVEEELNIFFLNQEAHIPYQLVISDMSGRVWLENSEKKDSYAEALLVAELPAGIYAVFVQQGKNKYRAKFIKR